MKLVLIGASQRGRIYADAALQRGLAEIAAVAEPNEERRESAGALWAFPQSGATLPLRTFGPRASSPMPPSSPPWTRTTTPRPWLPWT